MVFGPEPTTGSCGLILAVVAICWIVCSVSTAAVASVLGAAVASDDVAFLVLRGLNTGVATVIWGLRNLIA